jgi:hypothetical protein
MSEVNVYTGLTYNVASFETSLDEIRAMFREIDIECQKSGLVRPNLEFEYDHGDEGCVFHIKAYRPENEREREAREKEEEERQERRRAEDYKLYLELKKQFENSDGATND